MRNGARIIFNPHRKGNRSMTISTDREQILIGIIIRQFSPAFAMLEETIAACPETLWLDNPRGRPLWKRVLHALESVDYFLNDFDCYWFDTIGKEVSPEFDAEDREQLSREETIEYLRNIRSKCDKAFSELTDARLREHSTAHPRFTYLDIVFTQLRHLALNTGRCNEALAAAGIANGWIGYEE